MAGASQLSVTQRKTSHVVFAGKETSGAQDCRMDSRSCPLHACIHLLHIERLYHEHASSSSSPRNNKSYLVGHCTIPYRIPSPASVEVVVDSCRGGESSTRKRSTQAPIISGSSQPRRSFHAMHSKSKVWTVPTVR